MTDEQFRMELLVTVLRIIPILIVLAISFRTFQYEWWKTQRQCAYATVIYGVGLSAALWLCLYGLEAAGVLAPWFVVFGLFWLYGIAWIFRVEADKIARPVMSEKEFDALFPDTVGSAAKGEDVD